MRGDDGRGPDRRTRGPALVVAAAAVVALTAGCAGARTGETRLGVDASDAGCGLSAPSAPAGVIVFSVRNSGTRPAGFALNGPDGRSVGTVTGIGPGLTRSLVLRAPAGGAYTAVCTPDGGVAVRTPLVVDGPVPSTPGGAPPADLVPAAASAAYESYVVDQVDAMLPAVQDFADAVVRGDAAGARDRYTASRAPWERVEPAVEGVEGLEGRVDGREGDPRPPGTPFLGWHRLEKDLWATGLAPDSADVARTLVVDLSTLRARVRDLRLTPAELAAGARELAREPSVERAAAAENPWSGTDPADVAANVDGVRAVVAALRPMIDRRDPALGAEFDRTVTGAEAALAAARAGAGYRTEAQLSGAERTRIREAVDALVDPVDRIAGVVTA